MEGNISNIKTRNLVTVCRCHLPRVPLCRIVHRLYFSLDNVFSNGCVYFLLQQDWMVFSNLSLENFTLTDSLVFANSDSQSQQNNNAFCKVTISINNNIQTCINLHHALECFSYSLPKFHFKLLWSSLQPNNSSVYIVQWISITPIPTDKNLQWVDSRLTQVSIMFSFGSRISWVPGRNKFCGLKMGQKGNF